MKKISKILLATLLACSMLLVVVGCGNTTTLTKIDWAGQPTTEYIMDATNTEPLKVLVFSINVTTSDGVVAVDKKVGETVINAKIGSVTMPVTVTNFSVATAGKRTATVTIGAFSLSLDYTVTDPNAELSGDGTEASPYIISTAQHFSKILTGAKANKLTACYKLTADIDLTNIGDAYTKALFTVTDGHYPIFAGKIDGGSYDTSGLYTGNNFKLMNYSAPSSAANIDSEGDIVAQQPGLFYLLGNCEFKNIDIVNFKTTNTTSEGAALFGVGRYRKGKGSFAQDETTKKDVEYKFSNIKILNSSITGYKNTGFFVGYTQGYVKASFADCTIDNKSKLIASSIGAGGFVGSASANLSEASIPFTFTNCSVGATLVSDRIGVLIGNCTSTTKLSATNCNFTGVGYLLKAATNDDYNNCWTGNMKVINGFTGSNTGTFYAMNTSTSTISQITKSLSTITATHTTGKIAFTPVADATKYVVTVTIDNGSRYAIAEKILSTDTLTSKMNLPKTVYTSDYATANKIAEDLPNGIIVLSRKAYITDLYELTTTAAIPNYQLYYSVTAYTDKDIPLGTVTVQLGKFAEWINDTTDATKQVGMNFVATTNQ